MDHYEHLITGRAVDKDWAAFHRNFGNARVLKPGRKLVQSLSDHGLAVAYSTTRPDQFARSTWKWLTVNGFPPGPVMFRHFVKDGPRPAIEVKIRHWWEWCDKYDIDNELLAWFDDDQPAINALRKQGCPAWHPKEFLRAVRAEKDDADALDNVIYRGPANSDELADNATNAFPVWEEHERRYQQKRAEWFEKHQRRIRKRSKAQRYGRG